MDGNDLCYTVEQWDAEGRRVEQLISACSDLLVARAAYRTAVERRLDQLILLRQKTRGIEQSRAV
jgi:hypothetical protein